MKDKFYWIKLKTNFFSREEIDFILSQQNGCEYIVLYQMLCLNTANTNGRLESQMNEIIAPYDVNKIVRDCKYFDHDTVVVALELFKRLGLIYEEEDKVLRIANHTELVGSESASQSAIKKREYRLRLKEKDNTEDKKGTNCPTEYRDKSIEYRDKNIELAILSKTTTTNKLYEIVEQNFGRTLSPVEIEKIDEWSLSFDEEIIKYAISIATLSNKRTFKYVNGILNNWKTAGYKTLQEIKDNEENRTRKYDTQLTEEQKQLLEEMEDYDWLNDSEGESEE